MDAIEFTGGRRGCAGVAKAGEDEGIGSVGLTETDAGVAGGLNRSGG